MAAAALSGCRFTHAPPANVLVRYAMAADDPRAAEIGRDILAERGAAADAVVAMALTMTVTLPSRVGLGGGGVCLVHDPRTGSVRALDFLPRPPARGGSGAAVPGLLRGLAAVQNELGRARWAELVAPAEALAQAGHPVTAALARDLAAGAAVPGFTRADGSALREGDTLTQPELAASLAQIRSRGIQTFYGGALGQAYAEAASAAGLGLTAEDMRTYQPRWLEPSRVEIGDDVLAIAPEPELNGPALAAAATRLIAGGEIPAGNAAAGLARLIEAQTGTGGPAAGTPVFGATVAAMSQDEIAVVCGFTLQGRFGTGRVAGTTGIVIAPAAAPGPVLGGLVLLTNQPRRQFIYGGASADLPVAVLAPMAGVLLSGQRVDAAMALPRAMLDGGGIVAESGAATAGAPGLGTTSRTVPALGRGTAIYCHWDRASTKRCFGAADPRGPGAAFDFNLALQADEE